MSDFLEIYDRIYAPKLGIRTGSFRSVFEKLINKRDLCIVETGTIADPESWEGHGQSTRLFETLVQSTGGRVWSVDISSEAIATCRRFIGGHVHLVNSDSINFLQDFNRPIDLLYLDSRDLDLGDPTLAAIHCMFEFCAAQKNLKQGSIVLIDDTFYDKNFRLFGKGMLVAEYMKLTSAEIITPVGQYRQLAWELP